jgi:hypothetical protein
MIIEAHAFSSNSKFVLSRSLSNNTNNNNPTKKPSQTTFCSIRVAGLGLGFSGHFHILAQKRPKVFGEALPARDTCGGEQIKLHVELYPRAMPGNTESSASFPSLAKQVLLL